jgi:hypothetical protein
MYAGYFKDLLASKKYSSDPVRNQLLNTGLYIFEKRLTTSEIDLLNVDFKNLQISKTLQLTGQLNGRIFVAGCLTPLLERYAHKILPHIKNILNTNKVKVEISYYQESVLSVSVEDVPGGGISC